MATVSGLSEGYYEIEETTAPNGYLLDSTRHGIHIDPYNPATTSDPVLTVTNKALPSLKIRNAVEAVILGVPALALCVFGLPFGLTMKIIVTLTLVVPIVGFALIGIADDSLSRFVRAWWTWRRRKAVLTYRGMTRRVKY